MHTKSISAARVTIFAIRVRDRISVRVGGAGGVVALSVERRTCDQEVVGSSLGRAHVVKTLGKFLTPMCPCSPSSISWYRPIAVMPCGWGVKAGMVRVWVAGKTV